MNKTAKTLILAEEVSTELTDNILPFWIKEMADEDNGGFIGKISGTGKKDKSAPKGAILNARILWSFSAAYRLTGKQEYLNMATRAKREIIDKFYDKEFGGVYWSLTPEGAPLETKKQIYALGFAIYGLSEYCRSTGDSEALEFAIRLFNDIEKHSFDKTRNGYFEAFTREWGTIEDMRLSEKDANDCKTMNTHLHILEPYTALYRVWKNPQLERQLRNLIELFINKILDPETYHLKLFFDENWNSSDNLISFGHDIEASWLIYEAAEVLGDRQLIKSITPNILKIADAASEGFIYGGGMMYEFDRKNCSIDADRHWWVQAESVVGYFNVWQITGNETAFHKAADCWKFIKEHIRDKSKGEWFWSLKADGTINTTDDKAGFWKCPYHNSRMCLEIMERLKI